MTTDLEITGIPLAAGENLITVYARDILGRTGSDSVTIERDADEALVYDTFTDANSTALSSHTPDIAPVGASWALDAAGLAINTNRVVNTIDAFRYGVIDSGASDATITAKLTLGTIAGRYAGFIFRYIDANNYWQAQIDAFGDTILIAELTAGSGTIRATESVTLGAGPHDAVVTLNGTSIQVTVNGVTASYTSSQHQAATKHGILLRSNAAGSVDDFKVEAL